MTTDEGSGESGRSSFTGGPSANDVLVRKFWDAINRRDCKTLEECLAAGFRAEWPVSGERVTGREDFLEIYRNYPSRYAATLAEVRPSDVGAVTETSVLTQDGFLWVVSFFEIQHGRIWRLKEYWAHPYVAPAWRNAWVNGNSAKRAGVGPLPVPPLHEGRPEMTE